MGALIIILLLVWLGLGILGFVVKSLLWLGVIAIVLFLATAVWGALKGRARR